MQIVGITGGIGSGKSLISKIINVAGFPVFNSDVAAKRILTESVEVKELLVAQLGSIILNQNEIDRKKMAEIIFKDPAKLKMVNEIIHPRVKMEFEHWKNQQSTPIIFKEAAILIESGSYKDCDKIIVVTAPLELRIQRVMNRDKVNELTIQERVKHQLPEEELKLKADFIIENDESQPLIPQVLRILKELKKAC